MVSFPYYSHTTPIRIPKDMGIVWEAYHEGVPLLGVPENPIDMFKSSLFNRKKPAMIFIYSPPQTNECPLKGGHFKKERKLYVPITIFFQGTFVSFGIWHPSFGIWHSGRSTLTYQPFLQILVLFFGSVLTTPHNEAINLR